MFWTKFMRFREKAMFKKFARKGILKKGKYYE